ncbi:dynein regulatory complex protein 12 [Salarias fasciatus]|uniref:dynein regulatory complex protein 12 n=1 Tax=Salarias fasciatus TaxID=181472 RepID=UPI001176DBB9|nr:coiled-coil domain-containing protein 153-like [Salarias fasciatus]
MVGLGEGRPQQSRGGGRGTELAGPGGGDPVPPCEDSARAADPSQGPMRGVNGDGRENYQMKAPISADGNDLEEKYRRSVLDVAVLQDYIVFQCESARKVQSDRSDLRRRVRDMEQRLQHERQDLRDISSDLSRQYKSMKADLTGKVRTLEEEAIQLREKLASCQEELRKEKKERERVEQEKEAIITDLQHKLDSMESDCEKVLHETLDSLTSRLAAARRGREDASGALHRNYTELLSEFGLNALDV